MKMKFNRSVTTKGKSFATKSKPLSVSVESTTSFRILFLIVFLLCILCLGEALYAQSASPTPSPARFRTLGLGVSISDLNYLLDDKDVPIQVISDARSVFYPRPKVDRFTLYRLKAQPDGTMARVPAAEVDLGPGGELPLVILSGDSTSSGKLKVEVLNDTIKAFPGGTFRVLNRDKAELGAVLSGKAHRIPPLSEQVIEPRLEQDRRTVFFQLFKFAGGRSTLLYSSNWAVNRELRTMVLVAAPQPPQIEPMVLRIGESIGLLDLPEPQASRN